MTKKDSSVTRVAIVPPKLALSTLTIVGTTPLLVSKTPEHRISPPPKGGEGTVEGPKKPKKPTPEENYLASRYMIDKNTHGFPSGGIKRAMVDAVRYIEGKTFNLTNLPPMFHIIPTPKHADYLPLKFKRVCHDYRKGRNNNAKGNPLVDCDRARYEEWSIDVTIQFNANLLAAQDITNLLSLAGQIGIGALRPQKMGTMGQFVVKAGKQKKRQVA